MAAYQSSLLLAALFGFALSLQVRPGINQLLAGVPNLKGLGSMVNAFHRIGEGVPVSPIELQNLVQLAPAGNDITSGLAEQLRNTSVQDRLHNLIRSPELLMRTVRENPFIKEMVKHSPFADKLTSNPKALQRIFSPGVLGQMQNGSTIQDPELYSILDSASDLSGMWGDALKTAQDVFNEGLPKDMSIERRVGELK